MSERSEFDDVARRKLEEREFPFQEADWLEAKRLIAQQRSSGTGRTWLLAGVGVMLIGLSAWFLTADSSAVQESPSVSVNATHEKSTTAAPLAITRDEPKAIESARSGSSSDLTSSGLLDRDGAASNSNGPQVGSRPSPVRPEQVSTVQQQAVERSTMEKIGASSTSPAPGVAAVSQDRDNASGAVETSAPAQEIVATTSTRAESVIDPTMGTASMVIAGPETSSADVSATAEPPVDAEEGPLTAVTENTTKSTEPPSDPTANEVGPFTADTSATITAGSEVANDPPAEQVQDSASTTAAVPPPPPLITPDSPWEISLIIGGLLSRSTYTGGNSAEWIDGQTGRWSPAIGGEVMHMGRNFGIGSGLHYSTYEEDLHIAERSLTTTVIQDSNYFEPFHTTILYALGDTIIDGELYYVTESRDTTLNILVLGTSSRTTTRKLIDARDVTNRVSYLELPLLLDAHVVQGAWVLGLRGGPTVGLLSERRGALPNATFDGYTDFSTEQFRSPVFGFTARAYLRYRWVNGWSVGLEPTWRGHFGNVLDSGDLTRRSSAVGGMISVSYRLR